MTFRFAFKKSFGHLQDVLARCLACLGKTSLRHLADVFLPTGKSVTRRRGACNFFCTKSQLRVCWRVRVSDGEEWFSEKGFFRLCTTRGDVLLLFCYLHQYVFEDLYLVFILYDLFLIVQESYFLGFRGNIVA